MVDALVKEAAPRLKSNGSRVAEAEEETSCWKIRIGWLATGN
jgi:hypothetical protein